MLLKHGLAGLTHKAAAGGVETATFANGVYVNASADITTPATELVLVFKAYNKYTTGANGTSEFLASSGPTNSNVQASTSFSDGINIQMENSSTGAKSISWNEGAAWTIDTAKSIFIRMDTGDNEIVVDGTSVSSNANTFPGIKTPVYFNALGAADTESVAMQFEGWAIFTGAGCADGTTGLTYSDFFDGSDDPIDAAFSGSTVSGFTPELSFDTVASWNAYAGTVGTVT